MNVPFIDSRSSTATAESMTVASACRRETLLPVSTISRWGSRPIDIGCAPSLNDRPASGPSIVTRYSATSPSEPSSAATVSRSAEKVTFRSSCGSGCLSEFREDGENTQRVDRVQEGWLASAIVRSLPARSVGRAAGRGPALQAGPSARRSARGAPRSGATPRPSRPTRAHEHRASWSVRPLSRGMRVGHTDAPRTRIAVAAGAAVVECPRRLTNAGGVNPRSWRMSSSKGGNGSSPPGFHLVAPGAPADRKAKPNTSSGTSRWPAGVAQRGTTSDPS